MSADLPSGDNPAAPPPLPPLSRGAILFARITCVVGLVSWLLFFSAGLVADSISYRYILAPRAVEHEVGEANKESLQKIASAQPATGRSLLVAFIGSTLIYAPTNLAILSILAGLIGGCSSNLAYDSMHRSLSNTDPRRLMFMRESPAAGMIRGFVVYLALIAGLFFAVEEPFKNVMPAQFTRLAGTVSLIAFAIGYDPSRLERILQLVPQIGKQDASTPAPRG